MLCFYFGTNDMQFIAVNMDIGHFIRFGQNLLRKSFCSLPLDFLTVFGFLSKNLCVYAHDRFDTYFNRFTTSFGFVALVVAVAASH